MHHIYTTPAFVIHSTPHGEASKFLLLFTKDFGMIGAVAQGIRLSVSKLRYHVQDSDFSNVSIVRGKEVWRLTGAHELPHEQSTLVHLKILKLLKRLVPGEEKNEKLFEILEELYKYKVSESDFDRVECLIILRILNTLGYVRSNDEISPFLTDNSLDQKVLEEFSKIKTKALGIVNNALKESQL